MGERETIRWEQDADGVVILTLDDPEQSVNTLNRAFVASLGAIVDRLEAERESIAGVVITSAKKTFFAGGDLDELLAVDATDTAAYGRFARTAKAALRRLETLGRPVVAAINGAALGGGLELCLATHHRIAVDDPRTQLGFPEVTLGLLPGAGIARTVRLLGVERALGDWLLDGRRYGPWRARELGLVDEVVPAAELLPAARGWVRANPDATQPYDRDGYALPGGTPAAGALSRALPALSGRVRGRAAGAHYPAPRAIVAAAVEGAQVDVDTALEIETRYFLNLVGGQVAKNMIQAFFFDLQRVNGDRGRGDEHEPWRADKVVVLGAGMMGAAIAYVCAQAGIQVVLKDVDQAAADRGKGYAERLVAKGRGDRALLDRIHATSDAAAARDADAVIEAVFEDPAVKARVFAEIEPYLPSDALLGTNTSTLPITELAHSVTRPADFVGLHFFSPVDRMPLLEIIRGEQTADETVARALDLARQINKTPIVVNDSRGFFTSRVIMTFVHEAIMMLAEGVPAASIEQACSRAGYPSPALQLADQVNLGLMAAIRDASRAAADASGEPWTEHPAFAVIDRLVADGRSGRREGAGFYAYADGRRVGLWKGLEDLFPPVADPSTLSLLDLEERMLFVEALETVRCIDEAVVTSVAEANVGSILGIGFPGWTGGVVQYINQYDGGVAGFAARAQELAERYGDRFDPPASLLARAALGERYADDVRALGSDAVNV
jgi:3-hydroxyacyl-CoA dehydrogenase / enoyl-CoA hydratase / 3-hydroxybutyryl-CoA epimerase